jgi:hypothetical protein
MTIIGVLDWRHSTFGQGTLARRNIVLATLQSGRNIFVRLTRVTL